MRLNEQCCKTDCFYLNLPPPHKTHKNSGSFGCNLHVPTIVILSQLTFIYSSRSSFPYILRYYIVHRFEMSAGVYAYNTMRAKAHIQCFN